MACDLQFYLVFLGLREPSLVNMSSVPLSAHITGSSTDLVLFLNLKYLHNGTCLPWGFCFMSFICNLCPAGFLYIFFSMLLAVQPIFLLLCVCVSHYALISFRFLIFMLLFFFITSVLLPDGIHHLWILNHLSTVPPLFIEEIHSMLPLFFLFILGSNLTFHYYSYHKSVIYGVKK